MFNSGFIFLAFFFGKLGHFLPCYGKIEQQQTKIIIFIALYVAADDVDVVSGIIMKNHLHWIKLHTILFIYFYFFEQKMFRVQTYYTLRRFFSYIF